jgi:uncharacterized protein with beta-barrel porin domain
MQMRHVVGFQRKWRALWLGSARAVKPNSAMVAALSLALLVPGTVAPANAGGAGGAARGAGGAGGAGGGLTASSGGQGGNSSANGAVSSPTGTGGTGGVGTGNGGGGGGGAGAVFGPGGSGGNGAAGGSSAGQSGSSVMSGNGGGGGGAGGTNGFTGAGLPVGASTGGGGGVGGSNIDSAGSGGGGGGGAGGYGAVITGAITGPVSLNGDITGGNGGQGRTSAATGSGGGGGGGGLGLLLLQNVDQLTINHNVSGGGGGGSVPVSNSDGGSGGGGGDGVVFAGAASNIVVTANVKGGDGGFGGQAPATTVGAGGGGGNGMVFGGAATNIVVNSNVSGGNGGSAGLNSGGPASFGGAGGAGMVFLSGGSVTINATVRGGDGGSAPSPGPGLLNPGVGAAAIIGQDLTVIVGGSGSVIGGVGGNSGPQAAPIVFNGGTNVLELQAGSTVTGNVQAFSTSDTFRLGGSGNSTFDLSQLGPAGQYQGFGILAKSGTGTWTISNTPGTTMAWLVSAGTLDLNNTTQTASTVTLSGGTLQNGNVNAPITSTGGTLNNISGAASLNVTGGTTFITGTDSFTGGTTVTNATLTVNGLLSDPTIGAGGLLNGTGSVGDTTIQNGGAFAPGNGTAGSSMTVNGNLAFQSGAIYLVQVNPSTSSFANVTGSATLNGASVNAVFANGSYVSKQYTILSAGSVSGTFGALTNSNLPTNFTDKLSYDATHAYLDLTLNFTPPSGPGGPNFGNGLSGNQTAVGNALVNFFNTNGGIPMVYGTLTPAGLTQASGELATAAQQSTFDAMNLFLGLLTDPFMNRNGGANVAPGATGYTDDALAYARKRNDAGAMFTKALPAPTFEQRWSVWAAGFGGSQTTDGNAVVGSSDARSSIYGTAAGADYRFSPNTIAGFALAGGGTSFSVANAGSGRSDLFQAGAYIRHTEGNAYVTGALAYGWQDITTDRTLMIAGVDHLRAEFNANAYSGRVESGYRFVVPTLGGLGITPYAAGQFTTFDLPAYAEGVVAGTPAFALGYAGKSVTDSRSELGFRTDKSFAMANGILTMRGRFAWAHDFDPDRSIGATFQSLPGASFVVNGAAQASDSALTTASLEMKWLNGWSAAATFEGEFSNVTESYAGKGVVRYAW